MRAMPKTPIEKSIDLNTEAIKKLSSLYSSRNMELKPYIRMTARALEDIADILRGIEMALDRLNETKEGAAEDGGIQERTTDISQDEGK